MTAPRPPFSARVAANVLRLRRARRWNTEMLANIVTERGHIPMTPTTVHNIDSGRRATVTVDELCAFADALDVTVGYLLTGVCDRCHTAPPPVGYACLTCGTTGQAR